MKPLWVALVPPLLVCAAGLLLVRARVLCARRFGPARALARDTAIVVAILASVACLELASGRTPTYAHGPVRLWSGDIWSDENSQQIADPYLFTHLEHGAILYGLTRAVLGPGAVGLRAIVAVTLEAAWEVLENTDPIIDRYRAETISLDYYGDSVINSLFDILAALVGFLLAWRLPTRVTVGWIVVLELFLALWVRDNLVLNVVMLVHPTPAIRSWQLSR
jgi:Protein of unknown function (DUF2585)